MKFEELLQRAESCSEHAGAFIAYAELKKRLEAAAPPPGGAAAPTTVAALAASAPSVAFFALLAAEVARVSGHFSSAETFLAAKYAACAAQLHAFCVRYPPGGAAEPADGGAAGERRGRTHTLLQAYISLASGLVQLENYAVLCYAGIGKALKKHDKLTREGGGVVARGGGGARRRRRACARACATSACAHAPPRAPPPLIPRLQDARVVHAGARERRGLCHVPARAAHALWR
jgi:hypothetical protein